jgi:hypothetical protein
LGAQGIVGRKRRFVEINKEDTVGNGCVEGLRLCVER